jgi:GT2 family glycosyltransferase
LRLSIVIVNYRQWDRTEDLVRILSASPGFQRGEAEIVIVDNHSPAHPRMKRLRRLPGVSLRRLEGNRGFACAVNEGCRLSRGDWFLLLNPDTMPADGFLDGVLALLDSLDSSAGIVGFHLRHGDGSLQGSCGPFPTLLSTLTRLVLPRSRRKYQTLRTDRPCQVAWVSGCCLLLRKECLRDVGGLDENFFLYYEDVDLCRRARERGWSAWYEPKLTVVHHQPLHLRTVPAALRLVIRHSLMTYAARHWPGWQFRLLTHLVQLEAKLRGLAARWQADAQQARIFATLGLLCRDLRRDDNEAAQRRIAQTVRRIDMRIGV